MSDHDQYSQGHKDGFVEGCSWVLGIFSLIGGIVIAYGMLRMLIEVLKD